MDGAAGVSSSPLLSSPLIESHPPPTEPSAMASGRMVGCVCGDVEEEEEEGLTSRRRQWQKVHEERSDFFSLTRLVASFQFHFNHSSEPTCMTISLWLVCRFLNPMANIHCMMWHIPTFT